VLVAGAAVLAVLLFLSLLTSTPTAVLGALVVYAAVRMIDLAGFRRLASFRRRELLLALGCLVGVSSWTSSTACSWPWACRSSSC
jgi:MFS superfamily sulfate permease-like transporter